MFRIPYFVVLWLMTAAVAGAQQGGLGVLGRTTLHPDGTKSETISNPNSREVTEKTYDANGVLIVRKHYLLNERGQISQGNIYDGRDNLQARLQVYFDEYNRVKEERLLNLGGEVFQQTIHEFGPDGKELKPKVVNFNVRSPTMRPALIDFTQMAPSPPQGTAGAQATAAPTAQPATPQEPPKKSIWKRMFGGKKDK
ncbi:MAG: hypothetical protein KDK97_03025 [Verrucomicrobiales bacterium]|nr:hypothetical protein [Verrucomicrobiales bacterium]MCP5560090.1 hypothetical protein [Verrucomicrobiaceae bacterium]